MGFYLPSVTAVPGKFTDGDIDNGIQFSITSRYCHIKWDARLRFVTTSEMGLSRKMREQKKYIFYSVAIITFFSVLSSIFVCVN
ncbi:MAG: hypothetical protein V1833_00865 [Elusimicrobiota bacterium]